MKIKENKKRGFTLSETLITLAIIGVVAALTLPTMIANHQKKVYVVQLQKAISTLEQGFKMMMADDAVDKLQYTSVFTLLPDNDHCGGDTFSKDTACIQFAEAWKDYFNISQMGLISGSYDYCELNDNNGEGCDSFSSSGGGLSSYFLQFADGLGVSVHDCVLTKVPVTETNTYVGTFTSHGCLLVDVNGLKGPNRYGRDIFSFYLQPDGTLLAIGDGTKEKCTSTITGGNFYCASYLMNNGWVMDY